MDFGSKWYKISYSHKEVQSYGGKEITESPLWQKYTLSIEEASKYFRIGQTKLRRLIIENEDTDFILWNGNRPQIKRKQFEKFIDKYTLEIQYLQSFNNFCKETLNF